MRSVTIGIPSYNEEQNILNLLQSIEEQQLQLLRQHNNGSSFKIAEVIISDDSTDRTPQLVNSYARHSSFSSSSPLPSSQLPSSSLLDKIVLFHHNERRGAAVAWNEIFQEATGDIIVLYDADTIPHPLCTAHLASSIHGSVGICASNSQPVQVKGIAGRASAFISRWLRSVRLAGLSQYTVMGRALAIDASAAKSITIPPDIIAIDLYLQCRVLDIGLQVVYNDDAIVYFKPASNMQDFASQVVRAVNSHRQIKSYVSRFNLDLPLHAAIAHAVRNSVQDPLGAAALVAGYSLIPYYMPRLASATNSAKWHAARSSKALDYQELRARF